MGEYDWTNMFNENSKMVYPSIEYIERDSSVSDSASIAIHD